ncbi:MAG: hypothetical protein NC048_10070 [Bacteroides sp.]|nr:hypothetical protein [Bacteroides sp.]
MSRMMITNLANVKSLRRKGTYRRKDEDSSIASIHGKNYVQLLYKAQSYYDALEKFRQKRLRARKYLEGDQWCELIPNPKNRFGMSLIKEEDFIRQDGRIPFKQNIIAQLVNNVVGQYRKNPTKSNVMARARERQKTSEMLSNALQYALNLNETEELDAANLREFIVSGFCAGKITYEWNTEKKMPDVCIRNRNATNVFFNTPISDPRIEPELNFIGEFYDLELNDVVSAFAKTKADEKRIREMYAYSDDRLATTYQQGLTTEHADSTSFLIPSDPTKCRVYEIWTYEKEWVTYVQDYLNGSYTRTYLTEAQVQQLNTQRVEMAAQEGIPLEEVALLAYDRRYEGTWRVRYLSPQGNCIMEMDTPYAHGSHPYIITLHPLLDGNVNGLVSNIIDQQRYINRLISLIDAVIGASAKNLLVVPEECIPDNMDLQDYMSEWSKVNGVILYKAKDSVSMPTAISANTVNTDANSILQLQMQLINQISGINEAMQGQAPKSGTPSSLYAQQAENSSINIADIMAAFGTFKKRRDKKVLNVLMQFYKERRLILVSGKSFKDVIDEYDPDMVQDAEAELVVSTSTDTPVYRQLRDDFLMQLFQTNAIPVEVLLQNSSLQGSDAILDQLHKLQAQQEEQAAAMQQQAATAGVPQPQQ